MITYFSYTVNIRTENMYCIIHPEYYKIKTNSLFCIEHIIYNLQICKLYDIIIQAVRNCAPARFRKRDAYLKCKKYINKGVQNEIP